MKNLKTNLVLSIVALVALFAGLTSCSDDDTAGGGGPAIENISLAQNDSLVEFGQANQMYIIRGKGFTGTQKIYFNGVDTYFNSTLIKDDVIFVTIDENTPYENATDEVQVVTQNGTATYHFIVAAPAPQVNSFNPINAADGEQITIYGNYFLNPKVTVGGVEAQVVSSTLTQVVAVLPPGSNHKLVQVETLTGKASWNTYIGTAIYDDAFYAPWTIEDWNNQEYVTDITKAYQGTTFIKKVIAGWDNIQGNWATDDQISQYTGIHFSVRSEDAGKLVLIFNGSNWGDANFSFITGPTWTEFRFKWSQLGNPTSLQNISFQEFTGAAHTYYFDNIGYTLD